MTTNARYRQSGIRYASTLIRLYDQQAHAATVESLHDLFRGSALLGCVFVGWVASFGILQVLPLRGVTDTRKGSTCKNAGFT